MKCPNCGADMKDGDLYCEKCGEEIRIVPEFEPEIEYSLNETLSGIVEEVLEEVPAAQTGKDASEEKQKKARRIVVITALVLILAIGVVLGIDAYKSLSANSVNYQIRRADECFNGGDLDGAIEYCRRALELGGGSDISLQFKLAGLYNQAERDNEYTECLVDIIRSEYALREESEYAYRLLITYYANREDYASIHTLLINTDNETILGEYSGYMADPPEFSYQEGTYAEVIPLKLTSPNQGVIYYTVDGSMPDETSEVYATPIFLETGTYVVSAIFVNEYGIKSEAVAKTYVIDVLRPVAPDVETYSGEYTVPTMIKVSASGGRVYYTTDGTIPTQQSARYDGPIPMPLGKSTFKFVAYDSEGVASDCTTRQYELALDTQLTPEQGAQALDDVIRQTIRPTGSYDESQCGYLYQFQHVRRINGYGDYYVYAEVYVELNGTQSITSLTGTVYGVDIYTQECFLLILDESGNYTPAPFMQQ